jgi:hypothetical protein
MKKYLYFLFAAFVAVGLSACSPDEDEPYAPDTEVPTPTPDPDPTSGKTLIVYYSFTNNVHTIVSDLQTQIEADVVRVERVYDKTRTRTLAEERRTEPDKARAIPARHRCANSCHVR